ncbi:MAG: hypothetical protein ABR586_04380 [Thermoplasmatota archaeon]
MFENRTRQWDVAQVAPVPRSVLAAHATELDHPGRFGLLLTTNDLPQGVSGTDWITHDEGGWHIEDRPARWLLQGAKGIAQVGQQTFALVGLATNDLWRLDPGAGWQKEPSIPGGFGGVLSGNSTHLHLCVMDQQSNVVFLSRTPQEIAYQQRILHQAAQPGVGSVQCVLASQDAQAPSVAWFAPLVSPGVAVDQNLYAVDLRQPSLEVQNLGPGSPLAMAAGKAGLFLLAKPVQANEAEHLWHEVAGQWEPCPPKSVEDATGQRGQLALVRWGAEAALAGSAIFPRPQGNVTVQPLTRSMDCL